MDFNIVVLDSWSDCGMVLLADLRTTCKVPMSMELCEPQSKLLKGGYIGDPIMGYYGGYEGGY